MTQHSRLAPLLLVLLYLATACLPLVLSWASGMPPRSVRNDIASGLGLVAFAMILSEFVLSGRFRIISSGVGLDVTMRFHQLMARTALAFALLHPFAYQWLPGPARPWDPTRELTLSGDFSALFTGIAAFVLLPAFVIVSMKHDDLGYRYGFWRLTHGLGALVIAGLLLHHTLHAGRYSADPVMVGMWVTMTAVAAFSLFVVYVVKPFWQWLHPWRVSAIEQLSERHWGVTISPVGHPGVAFSAGQFVWLNIGQSPFSVNENPFSISSAPAAGPELGFVIKELGDFTSTLGTVRVGERAYIDGPHGTLTVRDRSEPGIAMIAGGVGIAPMLSIQRELERTGDPRRTVLIYGNRTEDQIVFRDELDARALADTSDVIFVLREPDEGWAGQVGLIDAGLVAQTFDQKQFDTWLFVLCGPPAMMTAIEEALLASGVSSARILSERFRYD